MNRITCILSMFQEVSLHFMFILVLLHNSYYLSYETRILYCKNLTTMVGDGS